MALLPSSKKLKMELLPADDQEYTVEIRDTSAAHLLTKIESFSMLWKHKIRKLESTEFEAGDYKWKVTINLDGDDQISVYLYMVGTSSLPAGWEVNAISNFCLYNRISDNYLCFRGKARRFHGINSKWGFSKLISKDSLTEACKGYILEDNCVFRAEVFVIFQLCVHNLTDTYKCEWKISEFSKLEKIWNSEEFFAGGYNWKIIIFSNGNRRACGRYVSIYLNCVDAKSFGSGKKVNAEFLFCFRNQLDDKEHYSLRASQWFTSINQSWGLADFKAIGDMRDPTKGFVVLLMTAAFWKYNSLC